MVLTEFDEKTFVDGIKQESINEHIANMLNKGRTPEQIAEFCGFPMKLVLDVQKNLKTFQKQ